MVGVLPCLYFCLCSGSAQAFAPVATITEPRPYAMHRQETKELHDASSILDKIRTHDGVDGGGITLHHGSSGHEQLKSKQGRRTGSSCFFSSISAPGWCSPKGHNRRSHLRTRRFVSI